MSKVLIFCCTLVLLAMASGAFAEGAFEADLGLALAQPDLQATSAGLVPVALPQPIFLTVLECRQSCFSDYQACQGHNPQSICWQWYTGCLCSCNDSCHG
jgi:hypothetical protein